MNLVDCFVVEIIGKPKLKYGKWFLRVKADSYGSVSETELMFKTEEEALNVVAGHHFP